MQMKVGVKVRTKLRQILRVKIWMIKLQIKVLQELLASKIWIEKIKESINSLKALCATLKTSKATTFSNKSPKKMINDNLNQFQSKMNFKLTLELMLNQI